MRLSRGKGFALIETLVLIAMSGIPAAVCSPSSRERGNPAAEPSACRT